MYSGGESDDRSLVLIKHCTLLKNTENESGPGFNMDGLLIIIRILLIININITKPSRVILSSIPKKV